ncbi:TPA: hypothetical protein DEB00_02470 [Candidatus Uhrbacteria bacterium]|nr:hypothetical protein [Candidatus Uhrbacteria bacterium]
MQKTFGITLVEGLLIGGIFCILLFATGISLSAARERVRDYKRISDVSRVQAALELYYNEQNQYPVTEGKIALGNGGALCLSSSGFQPTCSSTGRVFLNPVPSQTDIGLSGSDLQVYAYESNGETYVVSAVIERAIPQVEIEKGLVCARPGTPIQASASGVCAL